MLDRLTAYGTTSTSSLREFGLLDSRVYSLQGLQKSDKLGRKLLQRRHLRCEEGISSGGGGGEKEEGCEAGRLKLIGDIGVPHGSCDTVVDLEVEGLLSVSVNEMKLWVTGRVPGSGVYVEPVDSSGQRTFWRVC